MKVIKKVQVEFASFVFPALCIFLFMILPVASFAADTKNVVVMLQNQFDEAVINCSDSDCYLEVAEKYMTPYRFSKEKSSFLNYGDAKVFTARKQRRKFIHSQKPLSFVGEHFGADFVYRFAAIEEKGAKQCEPFYYTRIGGNWRIGEKDASIEQEASYSEKCMREWIMSR